MPKELPLTKQLAVEQLESTRNAQRVQLFRGVPERERPPLDKFGLLIHGARGVGSMRLGILLVTDSAALGAVLGDGTKEGEINPVRIRGLDEGVERDIRTDERIPDYESNSTDLLRLGAISGRNKLKLLAASSLAKSRHKRGLNAKGVKQVDEFVKAVQEKARKAGEETLHELTGTTLSQQEAFNHFYNAARRAVAHIRVLEQDNSAYAEILQAIRANRKLPRVMTT
ncbi:MAG: hypothetical protein V1787_03165 [Candidatus Micrarchaeota archaeon]